MTEAIPALMIIIAIAIVRTGRNRPPILRWDEMMRAVDWNIVMLFGGGLALRMGMEASGLADWIGIQISSLISGTEVTALVVFTASAAMAFVISYAASNTASAVINMPNSSDFGNWCGRQSYSTSYCSWPCLLYFERNSINYTANGNSVFFESC